MVGNFIVTIQYLHMRLCIIAGSIVTITTLYPVVKQ